MNYLFESKFSSLDLKFYEKLVIMAARKMPIIPLSKNVISRNFLHKPCEFHLNWLKNINIFISYHGNQISLATNYSWCIFSFQSQNLNSKASHK